MLVANVEREETIEAVDKMDIDVEVRTPWYVMFPFLVSYLRDGGSMLNTGCTGGLSGGH